MSPADRLSSQHASRGQRVGARPPAAGWLGVVLIAYALLTLWMLTYPFTPEDAGVGKQLLGEWKIRKINTVSNIVLFVPLGLLAAMFGTARRWPLAAILIVATLASAGISLTAETAQLWLRERESSAIDLMANTFGGFAGVTLFVVTGGRALGLWAAIGRRLGDRPWARKALIVWVLIAAACMAPFDVSLETRYLKDKVHAALDAGLPFAAAGDWLAAAVSAALIAAGVVALGRAMRESMQRRGERGSPWVVLLIAGVLAAVVCEVMQAPVRSRALDLVEPVAGVAGAAIGVVIDAVLGRVRVRKARPTGDR
jgi:VanZ family protein